MHCQNTLEIPKILKAGMMLIVMLAAILGCTTASSCQSGKALSDSPTLLKFQKTPCYGTCPSYEAIIQESGTITYIGWENTPVNDTLHLCLTTIELKQLKSDIAALNYASLETAYLTQWTDMPSTYLTFYRNGKEIKRIKHQEGGPEELLQFQEDLHKKIMSLVEQKAVKH